MRSRAGYKGFVPRAVRAIFKQLPGLIAQQVPTYLQGSSSPALNTEASNRRDPQEIRRDPQVAHIEPTAHGARAACSGSPTTSHLAARALACARERRHLLKPAKRMQNGLFPTRSPQFPIQLPRTELCSHIYASVSGFQNQGVRYARPTEQTPRWIHAPITEPVL